LHTQMPRPVGSFFLKDWWKSEIWWYVQAVFALTGKICQISKFVFTCFFYEFQRLLSNNYSKYRILKKIQNFGSTFKIEIEKKIEKLQQKIKIAKLWQSITSWNHKIK
jgi:hypothetical protein